MVHGDAGEARECGRSSRGAERERVWELGREGVCAGPEDEAVGSRLELGGQETGGARCEGRRGRGGGEEVVGAGVGRVGCAGTSTNSELVVGKLAAVDDNQLSVAVAEHLSFRGAAKALGIRQSVLSRRVRTLEDELGVALFERNPTGVRVTNAGARFFQQAGDALDQLDQASRIAEAAGRGATGQLSIGIRSSIAAGFLRELIRSYAAQHPDVAIRLVERASTEHISLIRKRRLDVAFVADATEAADCDIAPLWDERLFAVLPHNHPLSDRKAIEWKALRNEQFILRIANNTSESSDLRTSAVSRMYRLPGISIAEIGKIYDAAESRNIRDQVISARKEVALKPPGIRLERRERPNPRRKLIPAVRRQDVETAIDAFRHVQSRRELGPEARGDGETIFVVNRVDGLPEKHVLAPRTAPIYPHQPPLIPTFFHCAPPARPLYA